MKFTRFLSKLKIKCSSACYILPAVVGIALAWGLAERSVRNDQQAKHDDNMHIGRELASFLNHEVQGVVRYSDKYIQSIRRAYVNGNQSVEAANRLIAAMPFDPKIVSHITMLDANGRGFISSRGPIKKPGPSAVGRKYFQFARDHEGDPVYVSRTQIGRVSGKTVMRVVRRITLADGSFGGAIFAAIEVKQIHEIFKGLGVVANHGFMVIGDDHIPRASSRPDPAPLMDSFDKAGLWRAIEKSDHGVLPVRDQTAGIERFHAFRRMTGYPLIAVSSIEGAKIVDGLWQFNQRPYRIALMATLVILVLIFAIRRLVQSKNRFKDELSARLQAESEGREKSALLQAVFDNMAQGLLAYSPDERLLAFNKKYIEIIGLPEGFLKLGMSQDDVIRFRAERGDYGSSTAEEIIRERQISTAKGESNQTERITPYGKPHMHMRNITPDGGIVMTVTDISERVEVEQQLRQAQKMEAVGQLTGGIAHDFNNLLAVSLGNVELAEDAARDGGDVHKFLAAIKRATQRGAALTGQLLTFSRKQTLFPKLIDLGELTQGLSGLLGSALGATIEVEFRIGGNLWSCELDPSLLESAILNLAINARDAMPDGGKLTIQVKNVTIDAGDIGAPAELLPGEYVAVAVTDTGIGMSQDVISHVFEPFFTTKEVGKGTGLGLSMVYGFVKQSDGHVTIYSEKGHGTTVNLYLPRSDNTGQRAVKDEDVGIPKALNETILVVEDDSELRVLAEQMLVDLDYRVVTAASAREAADALERDAVDIILSDVVLPGGTSGPQFIAQARENQPGIKVVFMSGYPSDAMDDAKSSISDDVLLQKPFNRSDLARALRKVLDQT